MPHGLISIGLVPMGVISIGMVSMGLFSTGAISMGLLSFSRMNMTPPPSAEPELTIDLIGEGELNLPKSTPVYTIDRQQIDRQGAKNAADALKVTDRTAVDFGFRQNFNSQFGNYLNPSICSRWDISPTIALRGSISGAQRNPGLDQLYLYDTVHGWFPNPNLKPETGANWTAGVDVNLSPTSTGSITYFGSNLNDRLATQAVSPTVTQWTNIGRVATNGIEVGIKQQINPQVSAFASYTYTDAKIQSGTEQGLQLALVPYSVAQVGLGYANNGWELNLLANYNSGTRRALFASPGQFSTDFIPSFLNLDLGGRIPLSENVGLNLYVENLADIQYERVNRIYSPGRTYRLGVSANF